MVVVVVLAGGGDDGSDDGGGDGGDEGGNGGGEGGHSAHMKGHVSKAMSCACHEKPTLDQKTGFPCTCHEKWSPSPKMCKAPQREPSLAPNRAHQILRACTVEMHFKDLEVNECINVAT